MDGIEFPQEWTPGENPDYIGKYRWAAGRLYRLQCRRGSGGAGGWHFTIDCFDRNFSLMRGWGRTKECGPYDLQADCRAAAEERLRGWIEKLG